jgi:hypothetical protein
MAEDRYQTLMALHWKAIYARDDVNEAVRVAARMAVEATERELRKMMRSEEQ